MPHRYNDRLPCNQNKAHNRSKMSHVGVMQHEANLVSAVTGSMASRPARTRWRRRCGRMRRRSQPSAAPRARRTRTAWPSRRRRASALPPPTWCSRARSSRARQPTPNPPTPLPTLRSVTPVRVTLAHPLVVAWCPNDILLVTSFRFGLMSFH